MDKAGVHKSVSKTSKKPCELTRDIVDLSSLAKIVKTKGAVQVGMMRSSICVDII